MDIKMTYYTDEIGSKIYAKGGTTAMQDRRGRHDFRTDTEAL